MPRPHRCNSFAPAAGATERDELIPPARHIPWGAYLCLAASMALVGSYVGLSKLLVSVFPVFLLAWLRSAIAAIAMIGWVQRRRNETAFSRNDHKLLFLEALFGNFIFTICMLWGVAQTSALTAGVIMAAIPAAVAILSRIWLKERIRVQVVAGIVCAVGGIALVSLAKHPAGSSITSSWTGSLLLLGAVISEAAYVVIGKKLTTQVSPTRISAWVNLWGLLLATPIGLWQALQYDYTVVALPSWGLLVFYSLAASMVTVWLWMTGLKHVPASAAGIFTVWLPIGAAATGMIFLGERLSTQQAAALGLALIGVVLATWPSRELPGLH